MTAELKIPTEACFYILLQRTGYQSRLLSALLRRLPGRASLGYARLEARLRHRPIATRFERGILRDYRSMLPFLPERAPAILDIGCGLAAIDILLSRHYAKPVAPALYLADFEETSPRIEYGFGRSHARYNSIRLAKVLLLKNGVSSEAIHFIAPSSIADREQLPRFQLVVSTLAWGFHFPVDAYAEAVSASMADDGRLIADVRVGTDGKERLRRRFSHVQVIEETAVRQRVLATK